MSKRKISGSERRVIKFAGGISAFREALREAWPGRAGERARIRKAAGIFRKQKRGRRK